MTMRLDGMLSQLGSAMETFNNNIEKANKTFNEQLGIDEKQHDVIVSFLDKIEDCNDAMEAYEKQIKDIEEKQKNLSKSSKDYKELENKKQYWEDKKQKAHVERDIKKSKFTKLTGGKDIEKALEAKVEMDAAKMAGGKGGFMSKLSKMKGGWLAAIQGAIEIVEFGINKYTEYYKVGAENLMRSINATTAVNINTMKGGFDSWNDAVSGAYSAQMLATESQLELMKATNANRLASLKLENAWTNQIWILGTINKLNETKMEIEQQLAETRMQNAMKEIAQVNEFTKKTDEYIRKQDDAVHKYQALNGLTAAQTKLFEKRMLANGEAFAAFNKTIEDALKIQNSFTEQSGRAVNFSDKDFTQSFAVGRLVGEDNLTQFQSMMNIFNSSVSASTDVMYDMYNYANKMGLSQQKLTKSVLGNMKMAYKYDFKNGVKGFIETAKWAENARMSLSSVGSAIEKVQSGGLEGILKQSAELQVLGGGFAMGSDPFAMMFEAGSSPQDYMKRIQQMLKGFGSFNKETGETTFSWNENMLLRNAATSLGVPVEELKNVARGSRQKEYVKAQMGNTTLSKENQEAIANKAQYDQESGRWYVNTISGKPMDVSQVTDENMKDVLSDNREENAEKYAQSTLSYVEQIESATRTIAAKLGAATFDNFVSTAETDIHNLLTAYNESFDKVVTAIGLNRSEASKAQKVLLDKLGNIDELYKNALQIIAQNGQLTDEQKGEEARKRFEHGIATSDDYDLLKENPKYRQGLSIEQKKQIRQHDTRTISALWDWHRDSNWVAGEEGDDATRYRRKDLKEHALSDKTNSIAAAYALQASLAFKDGFAYADKTPMAVSATSVTPIHDGTAKIAKTDPNDSAIFAKTGGPFDTLFNDVFKRIDDVYNIATNSNHGITSQRQPIDINIHGDIMLKTENGQSFDISRQLETDPFIIRTISRLIAQQISSAKNGGRGLFNLAIGSV